MAIRPQSYEPALTSERRAVIGELLHTINLIEKMEEATPEDQQQYADIGSALLARIANIWAGKALLNPSDEQIVDFLAKLADVQEEIEQEQGDGREH